MQLNITSICVCGVIVTKKTLVGISLSKLEVVLAIFQVYFSRTGQTDLELTFLSCL